MIKISENECSINGDKTDIMAEIQSPILLMHQ